MNKFFDWFRTRKEICIVPGEFVSVYQEIPSPIEYIWSWLIVMSSISVTGLLLTTILLTTIL